MKVDLPSKINRRTRLRGVKRRISSGLNRCHLQKVSPLRTHSSPLLVCSINIWLFCRFGVTTVPWCWWRLAEGSWWDGRWGIDWDRMVNILAGRVFCMLLSISSWTFFAPLFASLLSPRSYQFGDTWGRFVHSCIPRTYIGICRICRNRASQ